MARKRATPFANGDRLGPTIDQRFADVDRRFALIAESNDLVADELEKLHTRLDGEVKILHDRIDKIIEALSEITLRIRYTMETMTYSTPSLIEGAPPTQLSLYDIYAGSEKDKRPPDRSRFIKQLLVREHAHESVPTDGGAAAADEGRTGDPSTNGDGADDLSVRPVFPLVVLPGGKATH